MYRLTLALGVFILQSNECVCSTSTSVIKRVRRKTLAIPQLLGREASTSENVDGNHKHWEEFGSTIKGKISTQTSTQTTSNVQSQQSEIAVGVHAIHRIDSLEQDFFERFLGFGDSLSLSISLSMPAGPSVPQPAPVIPIIPIAKPVPGSSCPSNPACAALSLTGECCPTVDNIFLDCCSMTSPVMSPAKVPKAVASKPPSQGMDTKTESPTGGKDSKTKEPAPGKDKTPKAPASDKNNEPKSPAAGKDNTPKAPASGKNTEPKSPAAGKDNTPKAPVSGKNTEPKSPAASKDNTPKAPAAGKNTEPKSPAAGKDSAPQAPAASKDNIPIAPAAGKNTEPKSPAAGKDSAPQAPAAGKDTTSKAPSATKDTQTKDPKGSAAKPTATGTETMTKSPKGSKPTSTIPAASPVTSPQIPSSGSGTCTANSMCANLGLSGECCPTPAGVFLDCCDSIPVVPDASTQPTVVGGLSPADTDNTGLSDPPSSIPLSSLAPSGSKFVLEGGDRKTTIQEKCGVTEIERSDALISIFRNISETTSLTNSASAPFQALYWVDQLDEALLCTSESSAVTQRYSLAVLYFSLNGPSWNESSQWLGTGSECKWYGVTCDTADIVTGIVLKENNLTGTLPEEIFKLSTLTGLSLDHNGITGTIPDAIGCLSGLQQLELDDNELSGSIPSEIYKISSLKALDLNSNSLVGQISDSVGNFSDLMVLQVENNKFTGDIPWYGLSSLDKLLVLYLHDNNFNPSSSLEPVCAQVDTRRADYPGFLQFFSASCAVQCSCCSECF